MKWQTQKMTIRCQRFLATLCMTIGMSAYADSLPKLLLDRVPHGFQVLSHKTGDLKNVDGTFTLAKRNDFVVFAVDEGGQCDPFEDSVEGLAVKGAYFTVQNDVACGAHWTDYITFRYVPSLRDWVFHKQIAESWVLNSSNAPDAEALVLEGRHVTNGKNKPPVSFEKYRPQ